MPSVAATPAATAEALGAEMVQIGGGGQAQPAATALSFEVDASAQPYSMMPVLAATNPPLPPNASTVEGPLGGAQLRPNRRAVRFAD